MLKRLAEKHPDSVARLTYQYRMHEDICQLSNDIVYKGKLKCANDSIAKRQLKLIGFPEHLPSTVSPNAIAWLNQVIDPRAAVVFLDTDKIQVESCSAPTDLIQPLERSSGRLRGGSIVNDTEASIVRITVGGLLACGVDASSIGVICPFRAQLGLLDECSSLSTWKHAGVELSTIDRYQGRDKPVIILSFVRSNTKGKVGRLLEDFRRLNVAVTRAKCKLIMIGSYSTLYNGSDILKPVLKRVQSNGRVLQLPENATQCYAI
jgi:DNA replication ATP-dependent helicase Dna2